jgi:AcrR family transcriptional regulator
MESAESGERVGWAGTTKEQRQAARQALIRSAALELVAEEGTAAVTVRSVCRRAKLTDRYFYESYESRDALVASLFLGAADSVHQALTQAIDGAKGDVGRLIVESRRIFQEQLLDHPSNARLLLVDSMVDPALSGVGLGVVPAFTRLVADQLPAGSDREARAMTAVSLTGALAALLSAYFAGTLRVSRKRLVRHCTELLFGAAGSTVT